jgi:hypothetical protein
MPFQNGYRGVVGGSVQTAVTDQPGVGVPGMLASASDYNFTDSIFVYETNGVAAGRGVVVSLASDDINPQLPSDAITYPNVGSDADSFDGIIVFEEHMQSDENGNPGWAKGRIARVARRFRSGARIWVKAVEDVTVAFDTVNWVTVAPVDGSYAVGEFAPAALAGDDAGTSVALTGVARWVVGGNAGQVACLELL